MKKLLAVLTLGILSAHAEKIDIFQKNSGQKLQIVPDRITESNISFELLGKPYNVELSDLTDDSVERIKDYASKQIASLAKANKAVGHPLFDKSNLWDEKAGTIAKRLKWKLESLKATNSSYRVYPKADYKFLGARPYSIALYGGAEDVPERISIVYVNKGDYDAVSSGFGEDHFDQQEFDESKVLKELNKAIQADEETLEKTLTEALGKPSTLNFGERSDRRKVKRWDVGNQSFLLSAEKDEFVHLLIVPKEEADREGKIKHTKDSVIKEAQLKNIRKEENGDLWIDNIPMVNQGPKGYCAPASFERAMRYMEVPADMYLLATSATVLGGGTNTEKLAEDVRGIVLSKARRIKPLELRDKLSIQDLKSYLDKGVPVLWQMRSLDVYNATANKRTKQRKEVKDFDAWAKEIEEEAKELSSFLAEEDKHHICLIIGYNEKTNEFAVSDSWGPSYELRWVHADIAAGVTGTYRTGFVIDF